jgi:putative ABC transport system substrate-binding protein
VTIFSPELSAKRLTLLKEILPNVSRVGVIWDPASPSQLKATQEAAQTLTVSLQVLEVRGHDDVVRGFDSAKTGRAEAINILASPLLSSLSPTIVDLAARNRLPAIHQWREHAEAGGLVSYGPSLAGLWRQAGVVVSKILNGERRTIFPLSSRHSSSSSSTAGPQRRSALRSRSRFCFGLTRLSSDRWRSLRRQTLTRVSEHTSRRQS